MRNMFKKLGTFALTLMVMFSMVTSVFAATQRTITLHTGKHDVNEVTFSIYKMMNATVTDNGNSAAYTIAENFKDFFVTNANLGDNVTDEQAYDYIRDNVKNKDFQNKVKEYVTTESLTPADTLTGEIGTKEYTTQSLEAGYYVIIPSGDVFTPMFTTVAKANQDVYLKGKTPDVDKTVDGSDWSSAQLGDIVHFKVTSSVPNMTGYNTYYFKLTDTASNGLTVTDETLNSKVTIGSTPLTKGDDYTVTVSGQTITIEILNFIDYKDQANEEIVFEYEAVLNENAVSADPETNTANVHWGNNPEHLEGGEHDTVNVRTYKLTITKTDGTNPLNGAEFELYKGSDVSSGSKLSFVKTGEGAYRVAKSGDTSTTTILTTPTGESNKGVITIEGLDDGTYQLVETKAPDGYNKLKDPTTIKITATSTDNGTNVTVSGNNVTVENNKGSLLPETGGMGTVLFTVVGTAGIIAVLYSFMKSNKKNKLNENK